LGASTNTTTTRASVESEKGAGDRDDAHFPNDDTKSTSAPQYVPTPTDKRAVAELVKRYYAAALAGDGVKGCSMLYSVFAKAVAEDYGQVPSLSYLHGAKTCAALMSRVFDHFHSQLAAQVPVLRVTAVRFKGARGVAVLSFKDMPTLLLPVEREHGVWRVDQLLAFSS
jgi:hypothetical protein